MIAYIGLILVSVFIIAFAGEIAQFFHVIQIPLFNKPYVKHFTLIAFLSFLFVSFNKIFNLWLNEIRYIYGVTLSYFDSLIDTGRLGTLFIQVFVYLLLSAIPWLCFSLLYWVSKKTSFPYFYSCVWWTWLVLIVSIHTS